MTIEVIGEEIYFNGEKVARLTKFYSHVIMGQFIEYLKNYKTLTIKEEREEEIFSDGYDEGYQDGRDAGYHEGYDEGYEDCQEYTDIPSGN